MPRSNRPRRRGRPTSRPPAEEPQLERALYGGARREVASDGEWMVRTIGGPQATKSYRCPGCDQEIPPGRPHVVAWPAESLLGTEAGLRDRRHWHSGCWSARSRRTSRTPRPGRGPRY